jgi:predicted RNase H-like HicB family nuclease
VLPHPLEVKRDRFPGDDQRLGLDRDLGDGIKSLREAIMKLKVLVRPETLGGYSVSVPALPGCFSQGETREEALSNIREAAELWLEVAADAVAAQAGNEEFDAELQDIEL